MKYTEAPSKLRNDDFNKLFLAGGITNCPDWQQVMRKLLEATDLELLNPRRADFPIGDPNAALQQITWEYDALRSADAILFWFPKETLCPIVLYELGAWSMMDKPIFVGVHPDYQRRQYVEIQTGLVQPTVKIAYTLVELADQIASSSKIVSVSRRRESKKADKASLRYATILR